MIVNPAIYGSSSSADYVTDGLVFFNMPSPNDTYRIVEVAPGYTFDTSESHTLEIAVRIDGIPSTTACAYHLYSTLYDLFVLSVTTENTYVGASSDYGINIWSGGVPYLDIYPLIPNLKFGDPHTIGFKCENNLCTLYFDGNKLEGSWTFSQTLSYIVSKIYIMASRSNNNHPTGRCYSLRWYSRALSDAEIAKNRAADIELMS